MATDHTGNTPRGMAMEKYRASNLRILEAEAIYIMREVVAEFERPVMLYSAGKDSSVMVRLAQKAFFPAGIPFPLLHVDTGFKFPEMYEFRDRYCKEIAADLIVYRNEQAIVDGCNPWDWGTVKCCAQLKTAGLVASLREGGYDAAFGGARRDEERSRAKERIFSFRDEHGQWDPKSQRPELWSLFNAKVDRNESIRVFPLSNWTELDVWHYIHLESIPIAPMYLAGERPMIRRRGQLIPGLGCVPLGVNEQPQPTWCRFRTLGCFPCTGAIESRATTVPEIIDEITTTRVSERITRTIDYDQEASMEEKKKEGYF